MIAFILHLPYTIIGYIAAVISFPTSISFHTHPYAFIFTVKGFWWRIGHSKGVRASTTGHVILLGPHLEKNDLKHELIHVEQFEREPFIHPFLYYSETFRKGYRMNKYEDEAYRVARNVYKTRKFN